MRYERIFFKGYGRVEERFISSVWENLEKLVRGKGIWVGFWYMSMIWIYVYVWIKI